MTTIEEQILDFLDSQHFSSSQARFSQASTGIPDELKESVNNVDVEALINVLDSVLSNLEGPLKGVVNTIINAILRNVATLFLFMDSQHSFSDDWLCCSYI